MFGILKGAYKTIADSGLTSGILVGIIIVLVVVAVVLVMGWLGGWAVTYMYHILTGSPEITAFWARWFIGIALFIIGGAFKSSS